MENLVSVLTQGITADSIFTVVGQVMPFVVTMIPISLGLHILRKTVKGASKAKVKF